MTGTTHPGRRVALALFATLACAMTFAACGGDDGNDSAGGGGGGDAGSSKPVTLTVGVIPIDTPNTASAACGCARRARSVPISRS